MAITRVAVTLKNAILASLLGGGTNGVTLLGAVDVRTGVIPASPETTATGTLVGSSVSMTAASTTMASLGTNQLSNPIAVTSAITSAAGYARWNNASGVAAIDMDATAAGGGGGCILSTLTCVTGVPINITNMSLQMPQFLGTVSLNIALRNKIVDILCQVAANIGLGQSASILIYSGAAPANADAAATGTLLATFPTGTSGWVTPSGGSAALTASLVVAATATGTAGYARLVKGAYTLQGSVGVGTGDFSLDSLSLTAAANTTLNNATFSL